MSTPFSHWIIPILAGTLALSGCGEYDQPPRGPITSESRTVGDFDSIRVRGSARLRITVGEPAALEVEGHEETLRRLDTEVDGGTLQIRTGRKEWSFPGGGTQLVIKVNVPRLESLRLEGGNDVRIEGLDGGDMAINVEGAANLKATGRIDDLVVRLSGAGRADLRNLIAKDAKVTVDGVGSVHVNATESLDATMNGVGAILYSGTPREVNTAMHGVGTISKDRKSKPDGEWSSDPTPDPDPDLELELERDDRKKIDPAALKPEYEV
jgi:hypothetical protein